ncbi:MAG: hypothetical protein H6622_14260 [Halobacteriovoraceae bacterium]|nr:hypothetical protein [Halobacteriovoraceae bacterium]
MISKPNNVFIISIFLSLLLHGLVFSVFRWIKPSKNTIEEFVLKSSLNSPIKVQFTDDESYKNKEIKIGQQTTKLKKQMIAEAKKNSIPKVMKKKKVEHKSFNHIRVSDIITGKDDIEFFGQSQLSIGLEKDEFRDDPFNSREKVYYSFIRRHQILYYNAIMNSYLEVVRKRPYLKNRIPYMTELLTAIQKYDSKGNIISIKFNKMGDDKDLNEIFELALKDLSIPNPPKGYLDENSEFNVIYSLRINQ